MRVVTKWQTLLLLGAIPLLPAVVHADEAVLVGVNTYPSLPNADLAGCVNDAQSMQAALEKYHFHVNKLMDKEATGANILQMLKRMRTQCKPSERFVFFFAGHGSKDGYLLPFDTSLTIDGTHLKASHVLSAETLHEAVSAIPGRSHTVFLDACYSASMIRDLQIGRRTRCVDMPVEAVQQPTITFRDSLDDFYKKLAAKHAAGSGKSGVGQNPTPAAPDKKPAVVGDSKICYVTAAQTNQPAAEMAPPGKMTAAELKASIHGLFTSSIVQQLDGQDKPWCEVQKSVSEAMSQKTKDAQKPQISPGFENTTVFENKPSAQEQKAPGAAVPSRNVWNDYNEDHANKAKLQFAVTPARDSVPVNEVFDVTLTVGAEGYLVILDRDASGKMYLAYPRSRDIDESHVLPGILPPLGFKCNLTGTERGRAILFTSRQRAKALIDSIPEKGLLLQESHAKRLEAIDRSAYYSADIFLQVLPAPGN